MKVIRLCAVSSLFLAACSSAPPSGSSPSASATTDPAAAVSASITGAPGSGSCVPSAPSTFANAICVCSDLAEAGVLHTHASASGAASVGVNGRVAAATGSDIEGGLVAWKSLAVAGLLDVRDALSSTGNVDGAGVLHVGNDLSVGGSFGFVGDLTVGGALRLAQPGIVLVGQAASTGPYVAPASPPCACDPSTLLPIASLVNAAATNNDNAAHGLGTTGADLLGLGALSLASGRYYFTNVTRVGAGTIAVHGAVAIFIDGSIDQVGAGQITIDPGASLDLYVSGVVATAGAVRLGDPTQPGAFRLFVGGSGAVVATAGAEEWNGLVYAPQAHIAFAGVTKVNGAIFAESLDWAGVLDVTYDGASGTGTSCPTLPPAAPPPSSPTPAPAAPPSSPAPNPH